MSTKPNGGKTVFAVEKRNGKCYTVYTVNWESTGDWVTAVILAVLLVFPACNLLTGLPAFGFSMLLAAVAAVAEECFFRGFLFTALQKKNRYVAALCSALAFALLHLLNAGKYPLDHTLLQMGAAFSAGLAFSGVLWKTKKLWLCILGHLLINLTGHTTLSPLGVGLTIFCIFLYAGLGILLLRNRNEVLL